MSHSDTSAPRAIAEEPGVAAPAGTWHRGWLKVAVALVLAGQAMTFGLAANMTPPSGGTYWLLHGGLFGSALVVLVMLGGPLWREGVAALRAGRITVDILFLVTLAGTFAVSVYASLERRPAVFYDLVAILLAIYTVGRMLGARSRAKAMQAVVALRAEYAMCVVVTPGGLDERRAVRDVRAGEHVRIAPGAAFAVDGVVREGRGLVWTTPLTGEPEPAEMRAGDRVLAGMRSADAVFVVEVTEAAGTRQLDRMLEEIESARIKPSRLQIEADRLAAYFVPIVVFVSAATFAVWWWRADLGVAIVNSLAVMVVACPCALGLATPLGVWSGLVGLGRMGIVARSGDFIDGLATANVAYLDKTGTLCEPALAVARIHLAEYAGIGERELRAAIAAAERGIDHPVAAALRGLGDPAGGEADAMIAEAREARIVPGCGIRAQIHLANRERDIELCAGSRAWLRELGVALDAGPDDGRRTIHVAIDGRAVVRVVLDERARERAAETFGELRALGLDVEILTGDAGFPASVWPGVARRAGVSASDKAAAVRASQAAGGRVLFVGDGLNDAPALATADASLAVRHGAELAASSAMAVFLGERLGQLPGAIKLARAVRQAIRSNLWLAAGYNAAGMATAALGWLHPVVAALLMAGSSAVVSARVLRAVGRAEQVEKSAAILRLPKGAESP